MAAVMQKPIIFFSQFTIYWKDSNGVNWSHTLPWRIANNFQRDSTNNSKALHTTAGATNWQPNSLSGRVIFEQLMVGRLAKKSNPVMESKFSQMPGNEPYIKHVICSKHILI